MNIATTKGLYAHPKNRIGWYAGGFARINLQKRFFLQPEILYSTKGNGINEINPLGAPNGTYRFDYLNVPVLIGYKIDQKTSIFFGPELGYLMSVQENYGSSQNYDVSKNFPSKFDLSINIGLNYRLVKKIGIEVRYSYGLNTFYEVDAIGIRTVETNGAHRVFQVGLNYLFKN